MYVTTASTLSGATFSCFTLSALTITSYQWFGFHLLDLLDSHMLWAQQLHVRLRYSVNLSRPTCAAYHSRLLWSARLTFSIVLLSSASFVSATDFAFDWGPNHLSTRSHFSHNSPSGNLEWASNNLGRVEQNTKADLMYFDASNLQMEKKKHSLSLFLIKLSLEYDTVLLFTVTASVMITNTATFTVCCVRMLSFFCVPLPEDWEFGDGNSFSCVCLVKSVVGSGDWCWQPWGVLKLFVFSFLSLFPSLLPFFSTNAQLQLFVSPPASCQLERLSVDILTQHLLPSGEIGMCQKSWWQATSHLTSVLVW